MSDQIQNTNIKNKGFTIIEVTISIFVITIGIIGIYNLVPQVVLNNAVNINRLVASQLSMEGLEIIRNIRDSNWLKGQSWDLGLGSCADGCEIDYNDQNFYPFSGQGRVLLIDSNGFYNYSVGTATNFTRKITITNQGNYLDIGVQVSWPGKYSPFIAGAKLYNWR